MGGLAVNIFGLQSVFSSMLPLFALAHFSHHLLTALPVPLMPLIREQFALNYAQTGLALSSFQLAYGISQLPSGWLASRIGPRILITIGICGVAVAGFLVGFSQTFVMLLVFLILMGVLGGGYHPSSPPLISASVEPKRQGRALGFHLVGGGASFFLAPLIAAAISSAWGWRAPFAVLAVPAFAYGIIFYLVLRRVTVAGKKVGEKTVDSAAISPGKRGLRRVMPFMALSALTLSIVTATASFTPLYLVDNFGVAKEAAVAFIAVFYFTGLLAAPLGGYLSDRFGRVPVLLAVCLLAGPAIYIFNSMPGIVGTGIALSIMGTIVYFIQPTTEAFIVNNTTEHNRSTTLGIMYFFNLEGTGLATLALGYLIEQYNFYTSFNILGTALLAAALVGSVFIWGRRKSF